MRKRLAVDLWQYESAEYATKLTTEPMKPKAQKAFNFRYGAEVIWTLPGIQRGILAVSEVDLEARGHRLKVGAKPGTYVEEVFGKLQWQQLTTNLEI